MCPEQGVHPNDDHPEGRNHQRRRVFEIWNPKTILEAPQAIFMQLRNALKIIQYGSQSKQWS